MTANLGLNCCHVTNVFFCFFCFFCFVFFFVMTLLIYEHMYAYSIFPLSEQKIMSVKVYL